MTKIVNLTPHPVNICDENGVVRLVIPSSGLARRASEHEEVGVVEFEGVSIRVNHVVFGEIVGLPEQKEGTLYIVSSLLGWAAARAGRDDVLVPDELIRDQNGNIIGAKSLSRL